MSTEITWNKTFSFEFRNWETTLTYYIDKFHIWTLPLLWPLNENWNKLAISHRYGLFGTSCLWLREGLRRANHQKKEGGAPLPHPLTQIPPHPSLSNPQSQTSFNINGLRYCIFNIANENANPLTHVPPPSNENNGLSHHWLSFKCSGKKRQKKKTYQNLHTPLGSVNLKPIERFLQFHMALLALEVQYVLQFDCHNIDQKVLNGQIMLPFRPH